MGAPQILQIKIRFATVKPNHLKLSYLNQQNQQNELLNEQPLCIMTQMCAFTIDEQELR